MRFQQVIGQNRAKAKVLDAIERQRLPHALLISGPEGVGKLAFARAIAQLINCEQPINGDSCGICSQCRKIQKSIHPDIKYVVPIISGKEAGKQLLSEDFMDPFRSFIQDPYASIDQWHQKLGGENKQLFISVHEMRSLKRNIFLKSFEAKLKVLIIWQAEKINVQGANAFLKLLEEPPEKTIILLTCSDPSKLLTTIRSRCQEIMLERIESELIANYLCDFHHIEPLQASSLASIAEGSIGNAQKFLSETYQQINLRYMNWMRAIYTGNYHKIDQQISPIFQENKEFQLLFIIVAIQKLRNALLFRINLSEIAPITDEERDFQMNFSKIIDPSKVENMVKELNETRRFIMGNANARMVWVGLSLTLHKIIHH